MPFVSTSTSCPLFHIQVLVTAKQTKRSNFLVALICDVCQQDKTSMRMDTYVLSTVLPPVRPTVFWNLELSAWKIPVVRGTCVNKSSEIFV